MATNQPDDTSNKSMDVVSLQPKKRRVPNINVFSNNELLLPVVPFSLAIINTTSLRQLNVGCYYFIN